MTINRLSNGKTSYQKTAYNAASIPQIINEPIIKEGDTLKSEVSISMVCVSFSGLGFSKLMMIIIKKVTTKEMVILSKKG